MSATREGVLVGARSLASWRGALLWASLAANVFFAGLVGAPFLLHRPPSPGVNGFAARLAADLPPADAARFRDAFDQERPWLEQSRAAMDRARGQLATAVASEPYDEGAVRERLQEWRARWIESSDRFGDSLLSAVRTLSPEGRQQLAATLRRPPRH